MAYLRSISVGLLSHSFTSSFQPRMSPPNCSYDVYANYLLESLFHNTDQIAAELLLNEIQYLQSNEAVTPVDEIIIENTPIKKIKRVPVRSIPNKDINTSAISDHTHKTSAHSIKSDNAVPSIERPRQTVKKKKLSVKVKKPFILSRKPPIQIKENTLKSGKQRNTKQVNKSMKEAQSLKRTADKKLNSATPIIPIQSSLLPEHAHSVPISPPCVPRSYAHPHPCSHSYSKPYTESYPQPHIYTHTHPHTLPLPYYPHCHCSHPQENRVTKKKTTTFLNPREPSHDKCLIMTFISYKQE
ncbi:hypothetical protein BDB01DRAFT_274079 [Pilobolus umbonatus]|nr:hypothetical protein BDB01DRAFT_274079 [Pilobolus umbonatus]